jgi:hypothetical protein
MELDRQNKIVSGSTDLMSWQQDVSVAYLDGPSSDHRWIITALGQMSVAGSVTGPAGQPMDPAAAQELDAREEARQQEADADFEAMHRAHRNIVSLFRPIG